MPATPLPWETEMTADNNEAEIPTSPDIHKVLLNLKSYLENQLNYIDFLGLRVLFLTENVVQIYHMKNTWIALAVSWRLLMN